MAPREELISSAVNFLQDPSVSSSPVEKKIEFLKSKNLTQEEVEIALSQASGQSPPSQNAPFYPPQQYQRPPSGYNYGYPPYGQWQQPPEPPKRDWRDWFIMATVVGGASFGMYALAQRYIKPLIAPPTPPQLEQDKAAIDEQFNRAFALLDTLSQDTNELKEAEKQRTMKLDAAINDIESIVAELKAANLKREDEARRMESEVKSMKDSLPRAIDSVRDGSERQLKELSNELASLKTLMSNRVGSTNNPMFNAQAHAINSRSPDSAPPVRSGSSTSVPGSEIAPGSKSNVTGVNGVATTPAFTTPNTTYSASSGGAPASSNSARPSFSNSGSKAAIPAWQMAAQKATATSSPATTGASLASQQDGADAVATLMNSSHNNVQS